MMQRRQIWANIRSDCQRMGKNLELGAKMYRDIGYALYRKLCASVKNITQPSIDKCYKKNKNQQQQQKKKNTLISRCIEPLPYLQR